MSMARAGTSTDPEASISVPNDRDSNPVSGSMGLNRPRQVRIGQPVPGLHASVAGL